MNWSPITWAVHDGDFRAMVYAVQGTDAFSWKAWCATNHLGPKANGDHVRSLAVAQKQAEAALVRLRSPDPEKT